MNFFPVTDLEPSAWKSKKRGRPRTSDVDKMATKAWYQFLAHQTGAMTPNRLGELFDVEDSKLFQKYRNGCAVPTKYVKMAERLAPGSRAILERGPQGLFAVMRGDADECWRVITEYGDDGLEIIGRDVPLDAAIARMAMRVAHEIESGKQHDFRDLVRLVGLFRIQCEAAKILSFEQEGLYELIWAMWRTSQAVATVLRMFTIGKEFRNWMADMQYQRVGLDKGWRLAFSERQGDNDDTPLIAYLLSPFEFLVTATELHTRHPYLAVMPDTISSFLTKSCARK